MAFAKSSSCSLYPLNAKGPKIESPISQGSDSKMPNTTSGTGSNAAVDFAQMLAGELAEIEKLRVKREWVDGRDTFEYGEDGGGFELTREHKQAQGKSHPGKNTEQHGARANPADRIFGKAHDMGLVGLAFSGGGIRSATFNLGVLQGLADLGLLPMFDYLSTVSGGGYIGGWLSAWIWRAVHKKAAQCKEGDDSSPVRRVQECLRPDRSQKRDHAEPLQIRFLREYSNYLTPRLGFLGADTWTAVAIYVRNLLLNQLILIPLIASILLVPHIAGRLTHWASGLVRLPWYLAPLASCVLILVALSVIAINMYHLTGVNSRRGIHFRWYAKQVWILGLVATPLLLAAWIASGWLWHEAPKWFYCGHLPFWEWVVAGIAVFGVLWSVASLLNLPTHGPAAPHWSTEGAWFWSIIFSFISGSVGGILLWVLTKEVFLKAVKHPVSGLWHAVSFGTPLVILIFLLVGALQIGLIGLYFPDPRREWWGRLGGYLLIMSIVWVASFAISIYSPLGLMLAKSWAKRTLGIGWLISTLTGIFGGKSSKTGGLESASWKDTALSVTPYVFIVGIASGIAWLLEVVLATLSHSQDLGEFVAGSELVKKISGWVISFDITVLGNIHGTATVKAPARPAAAYIQAHWAILQNEKCWWLFALFVALFAVCVFLSWRVNLNEFSMNLFYRNRLVRAYLGASHEGRKPNPFTGFDPHDELQLKDLRWEKNYSGPFPILNTTLNLVSGKDLAWQERKAESFVLTPLRCGFDTWLEQMDLKDQDSPTKRSSNVEEFGFRPTEQYCFPDVGLRLGTAMSISGAAASPNMGYHSSPSLAFLMTLFNVRLGFWAGNPRHDSTWQKPGPNIGFLYLLAELLGHTDDEAGYVYLSDGGHFENLGIYELVKRRCKFIVACDAGADPDYQFGDLGNAIRKCREDIGVEIELATDELAPKAGDGKGKPDGGSDSDKSGESGEKFSTWHWAVGIIHYNLVDPVPPGSGLKNKGILVYLKASITGNEPPDVLNYQREHSDFPHQTTADQWFTESQFESYRRLGQHAVEQLFEPVGRTVPARESTEAQRAPTKDIFEALKDQWYRSEEDRGKNEDSKLAAKKGKHGH